MAREFQWSAEHQQQEIHSVIQSYPFGQIEAIVT
jgi:hypothetical protein